MSNRYATSPLDDEPEGTFTFSEVTLLALVGVAVLLLASVLLLGSVCAEHRIAAALASL